MTLHRRLDLAAPARSDVLVIMNTAWIGATQLIDTLELYAVAQPRIQA